ncbi:MAG: carboxylesterase/lipase family protein [Bacteroidetes bacterium]|nr:carboxylesterase/lipase family protein [Bacteroidota bacterium]
MQSCESSVSGYCALLSPLFIAYSLKTSFYPRFLSLLFSILLQLPLAHAHKEVPAAPVYSAVTLTQGTVRGQVQNGVHCWKGIRYAQPPVGELRFKAPVALPASAGVSDALGYGGSAMQMPSRFLGDEAVSEDCLFLNIWSPAPDAKKRPVMVWIHGGGFVVGSGSSALYDGANLAKNGDVVVVTINYRLGVLGFLYFDKNGQATEGFENNLGISDQMAALRWVKANIAAFGGDPEQVTIFGESAGGTSVQTLLAAPQAKGLFKGAIAESGPAAILWQPDVACHLTSKFLELLKVPADSLHLLKTLPADQLVAAQEELLRYMIDKTTNKVFSPTIDGQVVTNDIFTCLSPRQSGNVALMIGTNKDESTMFASRRLRMVPANAKALKKEFLHLITPEQQQRVTSAYAAYPRKRGVLDLLTDAVFRMPALRVADCQSMHAPVYMYRFEWNSFLLKLSGLRSFHGLEIPFVFGNSEGRNGKLLRLIASKKTIRQLTGHLQQSWINFARYGSPNAPDTQQWKAYTSQERATMIFDRKTRLVLDPDSHIRQAWDGVYYY